MMTTEMTVEERDFIEEVYSRLDIFLGACQEYHDKAKSCRAVLLLADTEQDVGKTDPNRKTIQLQTLKSTYNNCVADQMDNMPEALMLPETKKLETVAEDLTDIVRFVLSHNHYEDLHRKRVEDNFATGTSITQIVWDPDMDDGEGNIAVLRWPIESFLWDPKAATLQDARALFKTVRYPMSWFEQHYPDKYKQMGRIASWRSPMLRMAVTLPTRKLRCCWNTGTAFTTQTSVATRSTWLISLAVCCWKRLKTFTSTACIHSLLMCSPPLRVCLSAWVWLRNWYP